MPDASNPSPSRRELLRMIGLSAGGAAMYQAMIQLGFAAESSYTGPIKLEGRPRAGTSVLILGAGLAGMTAAWELRKAGYKVKILEYNDRAGGRNWSLYGGDTYTELGGATQHCRFDKGLYLNPGPWRIPYHHHAVLDTCKMLGVKLEPFIQVNYNAFLHNSQAFGGKPQRLRTIKADAQGHIAELLSKAIQQNALEAAVTGEDREKLLEGLRSWGALGKDHRYVKSTASSNRRGFEKDPGGGLSARPIPSQPLTLQDMLSADAWSGLVAGENYEMQTTMFQPVGGMGMIGKTFGKALGEVIRYRSKITEIRQDASGVTVSYEDLAAPGSTLTERADWCLCTLPLSILSQLPINVGPKMEAAISAVPYNASVKVGLQFKRRFWEQDERIYGGISYTDTPIRSIAYPATDYFSDGKGVLLGAYAGGQGAVELTSMTPEQRIEAALEYGSRIHPQYRAEIDNGIAVAWHRVPFTQGCAGRWTEDTRAEHYDNLCQIDGRIALAGEHASYIPAWMEGAITSAHDAIGRLHQHVLAGARP